MSYHPVDIYLTDLESDRSRSTMRRALLYFARYILKSSDVSEYDIDWQNVRLTHIQGFKQTLQDRTSPHQLGEKLSAHTISVYLSAIRGVLRKSHSHSSVAPEHKVAFETLSEVANNLKNPKIDKSLKGEYIEPRVFREILNSMKGKAREVSRNKAVMNILYGCGLRCSELCALTYPDDIDWESSMLNVTGKGNKRRNVPLYQEAEESIEQWLFHRGENPGPLFLPISKSDNVLFREEEIIHPSTGKLVKRYTRAITPHGVSSVLRKACILAGTKSFKPHDFRRSYITTLFYLETDLLTIQKLVGHESADTTRRYDLRDLRAGVDAVDALGKLMQQTV